MRGSDSRGSLCPKPNNVAARAIWSVYLFKHRGACAQARAAPRADLRAVLQPGAANRGNPNHHHHTLLHGEGLCQGSELGGSAPAPKQASWCGLARRGGRRLPRRDVRVHCQLRRDADGPRSGSGNVGGGFAPRHNLGGQRDESDHGLGAAARLCAAASARNATLRRGPGPPAVGQALTVNKARDILFFRKFVLAART